LTAGVSITPGIIRTDKSGVLKGERWIRIAIHSHRIVSGDGKNSLLDGECSAG